MRFPSGPSAPSSWGRYVTDQEGNGQETQWAAGVCALGREAGTRLSGRSDFVKLLFALVLDPWQVRRTNKNSRFNYIS